MESTKDDNNNCIKRFLNEQSYMENSAGYHKPLYTEMNADAIAQHFYEQGKADAIKNSVANAKNIDMSPRQNHKEFEAGGIKVRVLGDDSREFKFKIKKKK